MKPIICKVSDLPLASRPGYRVRTAGPGRMTDIELLALVLDKEDGYYQAMQLLATAGSLHKLAAMTVEELQKVQGLGEADAGRLAVVLELGRRVMMPPADEPHVISSPESAAAVLFPLLSHLKHEELHVVSLDPRNRVIGVDCVAQGTGNTAAVVAREIFQVALRRQAISIVLGHNHPSGTPDPSPEDVASTRAITQAGELMDISVLDHVIIGAGRFYSLRERAGHVWDK